EIIDEFANGKGAHVPTGPQNGRIVSEPQSGLTALTDEAVILKSTRDGQGEERPAGAGTEGAEVPPSKAGRPQTYAPETNGTLKTPSPEKVSVQAEQEASAEPPAHDARAANMAEPEVEGEVKQRKSRSTKS